VDGVTPPRSTGSGRASYSEGFAFGMLSMGSMAFLGLVTTILIGRLYGIEVVGQFALAYAPTGVVWFLSSVREQPALVKRLTPLAARDPLVTGLFAAVMAFSAGLTVIVAALVMLVSSLVLKGPIGTPEVIGPAIQMLAFYVVVTNTGWNVESVLSSFRAGRQLFWIRLHQSLMYLVLAIVFAALTDSVWGIVWATNLSSLTSVVHRFWCLRRWMRWRVPRATLVEGFRALPGLLAFGIKMTPGFVANGVSAQAGTWILGVATSVPAVGAYNRAQMLGQRLVSTNSAITQMVFPTLVERRDSGDRHGFDVALVDALRYVALIMLLPAAAGGGAAQGVMALFGPGFDQARDALALTLLLPALVTMSNLQSHALFAVERPITSTLVNLARMVVTVIASIIFVALMGLTGAAVGLIIGCVVDILLKALVMRRHLTTPMLELWPPAKIIGLCAAYAAGFLAAHATYVGLHGGFVALAAALAAGSGAYLLAVAASGTIDKRDRERASRLRDRLVGGRRSVLDPSG
jgi:O-antigen/teichoic acid export membrane protein